MYEIEKLRVKKINDLQEIAKTLKIKVSKTLKKEDLIYKIIDHLSSVPEGEKEKTSYSWALFVCEENEDCREGSFFFNMKIRKLLNQKKYIH